MHAASKPKRAFRPDDLSFLMNDPPRCHYAVGTLPRIVGGAQMDQRLLPSKCLILSASRFTSSRQRAFTAIMGCPVFIEFPRQKEVTPQLEQKRWWMCSLLKR